MRRRSGVTAKTNTGMYFCGGMLPEHLRNDENYFVKPVQWKNVNPKGSPDLRKHNAARYVRRSSHLNTCSGATIQAIES